MQRFGGFLVSLEILGFVAAAGAAVPFSTVAVPSPSLLSESFATAIALLDDGRLAAFDGATLYEQSGVGGPFVAIGSTPSGVKTDPAFMLLSPSGATYCLGAGSGGWSGTDSGKLFTVPALGGTAIEVGDLDYHFSGAWRDETNLFLDIGTSTFDSSQVRLFDATIGDGSTVVVSAIAGSSAGIALAGDGSLYVALGYEPTFTLAGTIRRFSAAQVDDAISSGTPLDFDADGAFVYKSSLTAYNLAIDPAGYLWITGFGMIERVNLADPTQVEQYDPVGNGATFYSIATARGSRVAIYYSDGGVSYAAVATVPEPAVVAVFLAGILGAIGLSRTRG